MKLKDATILFVEDEPFLRESMGAWLEKRAGRAICAEHGEAALAIVGANKVDLVVSDVRMPVMDGIALLESLRRAEPRPRVILITGFSDLSLREAYEMGADAIVEKPINRDELLRAVEHSLAEPEELWRQSAPPGAAATLRVNFRSLAAALQEKRIAFGRRGFFIKSSAALREGPVDFAVEFATDRQVLSGQGIVRWTARGEGQAGIEIVRLDDACRSWALDLLRQRPSVAYIPRLAA